MWRLNLDHFTIGRSTDEPNVDGKACVSRKFLKMDHGITNGRFVDLAIYIAVDGISLWTVTHISNIIDVMALLVAIAWLPPWFYTPRSFPIFMLVNHL